MISASLSLLSKSKYVIIASKVYLLLISHSNFSYRTHLYTFNTYMVLCKDRGWSNFRSTRNATRVGSQLGVVAVRPIQFLHLFCLTRNRCLSSVIGNYATLAVSGFTQNMETTSLIIFIVSVGKVCHVSHIYFRTMSSISLTSIADFTRYARKPSDTYIQIIIIPFMFTLVGFMGIVATSAGDVLCTSRKSF